MTTWRVDVAYSVSDFSLKLCANWSARYTGLFGPSGSGKSTFLELLLGIRPPTAASGRIQCDGDVFFDTAAGIYLPVGQRSVAWVPQDTLLLPHLSVGGNLRFAVPAARTHADHPPLEEVVALLDLRDLMQRSPRDLSGGERQRVAIGRALLSGAKRLLLDEPLASLDRPRRLRLITYLNRVKQTYPISMIFVTHSWSEICELCDHVLEMEDGHLVQSSPLPLGSP